MLTKKTDHPQPRLWSSGVAAILLCVAALVASALVFSGLERLYPLGPAFVTPDPVSAAAGGAGLSWGLNNLAGALAAAAYEEALYRAYFPALLGALLGGGTGKAPESGTGLLPGGIRALVWAIPLLLFAAAHRHLGLWGMANGLCCGAALQFAYYRVGLAPVILIHGAYNLLGRVLLFF
jgi:hypothetical protein